MNKTWREHVLSYAASDVITNQAHGRSAWSSLVIAGVWPKLFQTMHAQQLQCPVCRRNSEANVRSKQQKPAPRKQAENAQHAVLAAAPQASGLAALLPATVSHGNSASSLSPLSARASHFFAAVFLSACCSTCGKNCRGQGQESEVGSAELVSSLGARGCQLQAEVQRADSLSPSALGSVAHRPEKRGMRVLTGPASEAHVKATRLMRRQAQALRVQSSGSSPTPSPRPLAYPPAQAAKPPRLRPTCHNVERQLKLVPLDPSTSHPQGA